MMSKPTQSRKSTFLRSKKHAVGTDVWPEIQLARIKLEPNGSVAWKFDNIIQKGQFHDNSGSPDEFGVTSFTFLIRN
jgi:hypothetical protein